MSLLLKPKPNSNIELAWVYDPGGTTGYARVRIDQPTRVMTITEIGEFQTWKHIEKHILDAEAYNVNKSNSACVVLEDFVPRIATLSIMFPIEVIGVIRFLCLKHDVPYFKQNPHEREAADKWIKSINCFQSHHGSAIRHAVVFVYKLLGNQIPTVNFDKQLLYKNFLK